MIGPRLRPRISRPTLFRLLLGVALGIFLLHAFRSVQAADPVSYTVRFIPSGDPDLDRLLRETSALVSLEKKLPPAPFALIGRAQADGRQFVTVLHSLGYDAGKVVITLEGKPLSDPTLFATLVAAPKRPPVEVAVRAEPGPIYHISKIVFSQLPPGFTPPDTIKPGEPALAQPIIAMTPALVTALHNAGYAFAQVSPPYAMADDATRTLSVTYQVTAGPRVDIGAISFNGLAHVHEAFLRRHLALEPGQPFSDTALSGARDSLLGLGVFSSVTPVPAKQEAQPGQVPVLFQVTEAKRHAVSLGGSYATDTGFALSTSWENRNVFGNAETLTITGSLSGLGGTATPALGYALEGVFVKPDYRMRSQTLTATAEALKQSLNAYDQKAILASVILSRPLADHLTGSFGLGFITENIRQEGTSRNYVLAQLPFQLNYDSTNAALEPTRGYRANLSLTPTRPLVGSGAIYVILQTSGSTYIPVESQGWGIVAMRALIGSIQGASQFQVPADERFYAGGTATVRGYTYQSIGPLFPDDNPEGGLSIDTGTIEFRQHLTKSIGIVPFVDAGQVGKGGKPFAGPVRVGYGIGARYYTSIGPIRGDFALPAKRTAGRAAFAIYVGLGEAC
jgi:translocation and assembly module TamA